MGIIYWDNFKITLAIMIGIGLFIFFLTFIMRFLHNREFHKGDVVRFKNEYLRASDKNRTYVIIIVSEKSLFIVDESDTDSRYWVDKFKLEKLT